MRTKAEFPSMAQNKQKNTKQQQNKNVQLKERERVRAGFSTNLTCRVSSECACNVLRAVVSNKQRKEHILTFTKLMPLTWKKKT